MRRTARPRPRRTASLLAATAAAAVVLSFTTACEAVDKALDCGQLAVDISADTQQFTDAMANADSDPQGAIDALNEIDRDLDKLGERTDNADVRKAVDNLATQVTDTRQALEDGRVPSATPVADATAELAKVCAPG
ncbi:hypothetical protein GCM10027168_27710 [Streptomyces capparidis]